ncbi:MAG: DUF4340 domain-containing protein, partial [Planctomycetaceae bacterium]|nr:DUF4340 domain-containing protein [Planctomycetaceae bacterium]
MSEIRRTSGFVIAAALSVVVAFAAWYSGRPSGIAEFSDVGTPLFPEFTDSLDVTELRVSAYDEEKDRMLSFVVKQDENQQWIIPSHRNYPAEAESRLARTAASMLDLTRVALAGREEKAWGMYGVYDPEKPEAGLKDADSDQGDSPDEDLTAEEKEERAKADKGKRFGTRVALLDGAGNALVDLIVGNAVEGRAGHYYVREPDSKLTYISRMSPDLSAKFSDWIEPDLLKTTQNNVNHIVVRNYSIDETSGELKMGDELSFQLDKEQTPATWSMEGLNAETEKLDENAVRDLAREVASLKIVDVLEKPEGIGADLTIDRTIVQNPLILQVLQKDLERQGFFVARGPDGNATLVSNEGEFQAGSSEGLMYTLYFGEVARGSDKDIDVDFAADGAAADDAENSTEGSETESAAAAEEDTKTGPRRYLLVKVEYDESLLGPQPTAPVEPVKPAAKPATESAAPQDDASEKPAGAGDAAPTSEPAPAEKESEKAPPATPPTGETKPTSADESAEPSSAPQENSSSDSPPADGECLIVPDEDATTSPDSETEEPAASPAAETPSTVDEPAENSPAAESPAAQESPTTNPPAADQPAPAQTTSENEESTTSAEPNAAAPSSPMPGQGGDESAVPAVDPDVAYQKAMAEYEIAKLTYERELKEWNDRAEAGQKKTAELKQRFAKWYYIISADSFEKFRPTRKSLVSLKAEQDAPADAGGPLPGGFLPPQR